MKRLLAVFLCCSMLLCGAYAETGVDVKSMSDAELAALTADALSEMKVRLTPQEAVPITGYAEEITFRDAHWGMNPDAFKELMAKIGVSGSVRDSDAWSLEMDYNVCGFNYLRRLDGHAFQYTASPRI